MTYLSFISLFLLPVLLVVFCIFFKTYNKNKFRLKGIIILVLIAVIYISAKPISMGIEARRNINEKDNSDKLENKSEDIDENNINISSEIIRLNKLKNEGVLTEKEYEQAKRKLLD